MKPRILPEQFALTAFWLAATPGFAADLRPPQWYEIATGIIAIPAALIGLAYSYLLRKKTRPEARKTELEILEKENQQLVSSRKQQESLLRPAKAASHFSYCCASLFCG